TYLYDKSKGATMLEIPFAHTLAGIKYVLGDYGDLTSKLIRRRETVKVSETGKDIPRSDFDQIMVHGVMKSGAAFSAHYRGGMSKGTNLLWEINGTDGDLQITGNIGHGQFAEMVLNASKASEDEDLKVMDIPEEYSKGRPDGVIASNVAGVYALVADDIQNGTKTAPSFAEALALHEVLARIEG
ncbi:MAG: hypothetical protein KDK61_08325, partial [Simkania sp.]|nr:hypothetical protein [Simkania sp.]